MWINISLCIYNHTYLLLALLVWLLLLLLRPPLLRLLVLPLLRMLRRLFRALLSACISGMADWSCHAGSSSPSSVLYSGSLPKAALRRFAFFGPRSLSVPSPSTRSKPSTIPCQCRECQVWEAGCSLRTAFTSVPYVPPGEDTSSLVLHLSMANMIIMYKIGEVT